MFPTIKQLASALHRLRKPLTAEEQSASEQRIWQSLSSRLNQAQSMNSDPIEAQPISHRSLLPQLSFAFLIILVLVGGVLYHQNRSNQTEKPIVAQSTPALLTAESTLVKEAGTQGRALGTASTSSLGYVPVAQVSAQRPSKNVAYAAEEPIYVPVIFYTKVDPNGGSSSRIFSYAIKTGKETALTAGTDYVESPLFSSTGQKLAYESNTGYDFNSGPPDHMDLVILDYTTNKVLKRISEKNILFFPVSWSPDGKKLLVEAESANRPLEMTGNDTIPATGATMRLYDLATETLTTLTTPKPNVNPDFGGSWMGIQNFSISYSTIGAPSEKAFAGLYSYNVVNATFTEIKLSYPYASGYQEANNEAFYLAFQPDPDSSEMHLVLATEHLDKADSAKILYSKDFPDSFILRKDSTGKVTDILFTRPLLQTLGTDATPQPTGSVDMGIIDIDPATGTIKPYPATIGATNYIVGWLTDYNHLIYQFIDSTGSLNFYQEDLQTGTSTLINRLSMAH